MSGEKFTISVECFIGRERGGFTAQLKFSGLPDAETAGRLAHFLEGVVKSEVIPVLEGDDYQLSAIRLGQ